MTFRRLHLGTLATSLTIQICGVITGIVTARSLGPVARGEFVAILLWPTIMSNIGLVGCNWAVARAVAAEPQREAYWTRVSAVVALMLSAAVVACGYFLLPVLLPADKLYLLSLSRVCLLLVPLDVFSQMLLATEHGRMRWWRYNVIRMSFYVAYAPLILMLWAIHRANLTSFAIVFLGSHLLAVLLRLAVHWRAILHGGVRLADCWKLLRSGLPFVWSTASNLLALQVDKILVVALLHTEAVGLYAAAVTFSSAHSAFGETLGITAFAQLANEQDTRVQARILAESFRQALVLACGLGLLLVGVVPFVVVPLFGHGFAAAVRPAMILTIAASLTAVSSVLNQGLKGAGKPAPGVISQLVGAVVLGLVGLALHRSMGLSGIAIAGVVSAATQVALLILSAAISLRVSPALFLSFDVKELRSIVRTLMSPRLRYS